MFLASCIAELQRLRFLPIQDDSAAAKAITPLLTLRWTFRAKGACVWLRIPSLNGSLLSPASADGPPRGLGGGGALLRRHWRDVAPMLSRGVLHVQA
jgi:hypothetical protein